MESRPRRGGRRHALACVIAVGFVCAAVAALPASAGATGARAVTGSFTDANSFPDDGAIAACGFPVTFSYSVQARFAFHLDASGNVVNGSIHSIGTAAESANGITLAGRIADQEILFTGPQLEYEVGLVDTLKLPNGGVVQIDVGRIVWTFDALMNGGPPTVIEGPHQSLVGDDAELCAALTP
jgi:hypothetical protein